MFHVYIKDYIKIQPFETSVLFIHTTLCFYLISKHVSQIEEFIHKLLCFVLTDPVSEMAMFMVNGHSLGWQHMVTCLSPGQN